MAKLSDITFQAPDAAVTANSNASAISAGSLFTGGTSTQLGKVSCIDTTTGWIEVNLSTLSGSSVGLTRGTGGKFKMRGTTVITPQVGTIVNLRGGGSGAVYLAGLQIDASGVVAIRYRDNSGLVTSSSIGNTIKDGAIHDVFLGYVCSASAGAGQVICIIDGSTVYNNTFTNSSAGYGSGVDTVRFGQLTGQAGNNFVTLIDGAYITDSLGTFTSSEAGTSGSTISGYSGPVANTTRTITLTTTYGTPSWSTDDTSVATISAGGVVTLLQAAGGTVVVSDGFTSIQVEFLPRTIGWLVGGYRGAGGVGGTINFGVAVNTSSDSYLLYPDLVPGILGGTNTLPSGVTAGGNGNFQVIMKTTGSGSYTAYVAGTLVTLGILKRRRGTFNGFQEMTGNL